MKKTKTRVFHQRRGAGKAAWANIPSWSTILEYRQLAKLKSTYVDGLTKVIGSDGRIHTSFQNTVTATGRLQLRGAQPPEHPRPHRAGGRSCARCSWPGPGKVLVDADYSQIELRLLAHIAEDAGT